MNEYWLGVTIPFVLISGFAISRIIRMLTSSMATTEDPGQRVVEAPSVDYRAYVASKFAHLERGQQLGPPEDREPHPLDEVIESVISALRSETRMYPEAYAWIITDAIRELSPEKRGTATAWDFGSACPWCNPDNRGAGYSEQAHRERHVAGGGVM